MNLNLAEKKIVVTGGSKGLGLEIVRSLLDEGALVTMCARNKGTLNTASSLLSLSHERLFTFSVDVKEKASIQQCVEFSSDSMGGIDAIVNNAGGATRFADFFSLDEDDWLTAFALNTMSVVNFSKAAYPYLKKSPTGRIINIASLTGLQPSVFNPHYSACKAATINLTKSMANIMAEDGVLVNAISAGTFESASWDRNIHRVAEEKSISLSRATEEEESLASSTIPLGRIGSGQDIVPLILLLLSEKSSWTTGSCFTIDGGKAR